MPDDRTVIVVGDGPTRLSAALFLAKNGFQVDVVGADETPAHKALLHNYLAADGLPGPEFVAQARAHAERFGARLHRGKVEAVEPGERFRVRTDGGTVEGRFLVLATGFDDDLVAGLGLERAGDGVRADRDGRTSRDRVYAGGALVRGNKTQVATSVGDGAAIALDILSGEQGKPAHDWDVLKPKARTAPPAPGSPAPTRAG